MYTLAHLRDLIHNTFNEKKQAVQETTVPLTTELKNVYNFLYFTKYTP